MKKEDKPDKSEYLFLAGVIIIILAYFVGIILVKSILIMIAIILLIIAIFWEDKT